MFLKYYGERVVSAVGMEIDRIEEDIRKLHPGVRYVDLEVDRGRRGSLSVETFSKGLAGVDLPEKVKIEMLSKMSDLRLKSYDEFDDIAEEKGVYLMEGRSGDSLEKQ